MGRLSGFIIALLSLTTLGGGPTGFTGWPPGSPTELPTDDRFVIQSGGNAVHDLETNLVWDRVSMPFPILGTVANYWQEAQLMCYRRFTDNHGGWRLPTLSEISSVLIRSDTPSFPDVIGLPPGHPFRFFARNKETAALPVEKFPGQEAYIDFVTSARSHFANLSYIIVRIRPDKMEIQEAPTVATTPNITVWCVRGGFDNTVVEGQLKNIFVTY